jgi:heptosyltransferase-2
VLAWPVVEAAAALGAAFVGPPPFETLLRGRFPDAIYLPTTRGRRYALVGPIRSLGPSAALLLTDSFSSTLLAVLARIPSRIGYAAEGRGFLLTRRVRRAGPARSTRRAAEYRVLGEAAGLLGMRDEPSLRSTSQEAERGAAALARFGLAGGDYAVLAPGASYGPAKQWGADRFAALGARAAKDHGLAIVVVGSAEDRPVSAAVARAAEKGGATVFDVTGATDLAELTGILGRSRAVVSNDSGVMHLAAALGRPTVAVFGSTSPVWTSAAAPWVANLYAAYPCSPCFRRTCPIGYRCLEAIGADAAVAALDRVLT